MGDDFRDTFMGNDSDNSAEDHLNSNFGVNDNFSDKFNSPGQESEDDIQDEFTSRFGNQQSNDEFNGENFGENFQGDDGSGKSGKLLSGIIGTIIASKLFSMVDKNGSISRLLGINTNDCQHPQHYNNGQNPQQAQAPSKPGGKGIIGNALSVVGILVGIGIILFFTFYVMSFFLHGNLGPNGKNGTTESADISPWLDRLSGKKNNNLVIVANSNKKDIVPYRFDKEEELVYFYLDSGEVTLKYDKEEWKNKYEITDLPKVGYMAIGATLQPDGTVVNVQPIGIYDGKTTISTEDENQYIAEDNLKGLGITKIEYEKLKIAKKNGIKGSLFLNDKERKDKKSTENPNNSEYMESLPQMDEKGNIVVKPSGENKAKVNGSQGLTANDILERENNQTTPSNYDESEVQNSEGVRPDGYFQGSNTKGVTPQKYFQEEKKEIVVKPAESGDNRERMRKNLENYNKEEELREYIDKNKKELEDNEEYIEEGKKYVESQKEIEKSDGTEQLISRYKNN